MRAGLQLLRTQPTKIPLFEPTADCHHPSASTPSLLTKAPSNAFSSSQKKPGSIPPLEFPSEQTPFSINPVGADVRRLKLFSTWDVRSCQRTAKVGRVTPCAPGQVASEDGAHGVTRPTWHNLGASLLVSCRSALGLRFSLRRFLHFGWAMLAMFRGVLSRQGQRASVQLLRTQPIKISTEVSL